VQIDDRGFIKWEDAYDRTAVAIQWVSLFTSFKFYRMTYSFFMGRKQFLVLYQKKKFKKMLVIQTLFSMFFVELLIIIAGVMGAANLPRGNQLYTTLLDSVFLCIFLLVMEFVEIARLDLIMRTVNTAGKQSRKSETACQSSDDENALSTGESEEDDDWPDWRLMLKNVEGNRGLFEKSKL
jgi:polyferredoxin